MTIANNPDAPYGLTRRGTPRRRPARAGEGRNYGQPKHPRKKQVSKLKLESLKWDCNKEKQVLAWAAEGKTYEDIVEALGCTPGDFWQVLDNDPDFMVRLDKAMDYHIRGKVTGLVRQLEGAQLSNAERDQVKEALKHYRWLAERRMTAEFGEGGQKRAANAGNKDKGGVSEHLQKALEIKKRLQPPPG